MDSGLIKSSRLGRAQWFAASVFSPGFAVGDVSGEFKQSRKQRISPAVLARRGITGRFGESGVQ
jgi:hypothetical protein